MKKLFTQLFTVLCIAFNTPAIAGVTPGGEGEFELDNYDYVGHDWTNDGPSGVLFKGKWKASVLVGEPLKIVSMKWKVGSSVRFDGEDYSSDSSPEKCDYIPQSVINNIEIIDLEIRGRIGKLGLKKDVYLFINADAMAKPGNNTKWGKSNLTIPSSPDWDGLFSTAKWDWMRSSLAFLSEEDAKNIMRGGFSFSSMRISKLSFNMTSVRMWLLKNKCNDKEILQEQLTGSRVIDEQDEQSKSEVTPDFEAQLSGDDTDTNLLDDVASLWDEFTAEETDFERALASEEEELDFESQLAGVDEYREDLAVKKAETYRKEQIRLQKERALEVKRQQEMAAQDHLYESFKVKVKGKEHDLYGFKKNGTVVINPEYDQVTQFEDGVAIVCIEETDMEEGGFVSKLAFIDHDNNILGGWRKRLTSYKTGCDTLSHNGLIIISEIINYKVLSKSRCRRDGWAEIKERITKYNKEGFVSSDIQYREKSIPANICLSY